MGEITRRLFRHFTTQQSSTASPPRHPRIPHPVRTFTPTTTQNSGVARRGRAREGETAFATPSASPSRKLPPSKRPNLYPKNKNQKHMKKETVKPIKSNSLKKKKKTLFILTLSYLFLTFSSISSALSISLFSSFGRTILRIIANTAAGTIPDPPKIRLIACGRCARIAVLEPSP